MSTLISRHIYDKELATASLSDPVFGSDLGKQCVFQRRELLSSEENSLWQISKGIVRVYTYDQD